MARRYTRPQLPSNGNKPHKNLDLTANVLELFLRFGLNVRAIDRLLKLSSTRGGKSSQEILAMFGVTEPVKCAVIGCSQEQFDAVLGELRKTQRHYQTKIGRPPDPKHVAEVAVIINEHSPESSLAKLQAYRGVFLTVRDVTSFHNAVCGEVRNLTQKVFKRLKLLVGCCQYEKCKPQASAARLDTAHIGLSRPKIFTTHAVQTKRRESEGMEITFDMYASMLAYLRAHRKKHCRVRFLCTKPCHRDLEAIQTTLKKKGLKRETKTRLKKQLEQFTARIA